MIPIPDTPAIPTELQGTLPGSAYLDPAAFAAERERIFFREWFCVGRDETLPGPGDFLHDEVVGERVIVARTGDGSLRGHYDVCRHRGSRLVLEPDPRALSDPVPSGRFRGSIVCPYHAWTYALTGELRSAPHLRESDGLRREQLALHPVGVQTWGGFVFVHLTPSEAVPLATQLGGMPDRLANYPLRDLRTARRLSYEVSANWKVVVENFNECYHCGPVHPELCEVVPAFKRDGGRNLDWDHGIPHREGATTFTLSGTTDRAPFPGLTEEERTRHKGELVFPNLMVSLSADHVAAFRLWPLDEGTTRIDCDVLFHPDEMRRGSFDPGDAVELWDLVNRQDWRVCASVQEGMSSRVFGSGFYAPMEDLSLDIRRYVGERLGEEVLAGRPTSARSSTPTASTTSGPR